ncbi:MAG TPA: CHRD domain-containing protein, partial [Planctomycetota bacterium]|nr:CHRD domain-containing protein [Planctomycetota bacterium]
MNARFAVALSAALAAIASAAGAQERFGARLQASETVPPSTSPATGRGWFDLDPVTLQLRCRVETSAPATAVVLHRGYAGANGAAVLPLVNTSAMTWEGITAPFFGPDLDSLWWEGFYVAVYTATFPQNTTGGALRDQLTRARVVGLDGKFDGMDVVPPTGSPGHGHAHGTLRLPEGVVTYDVEVEGLTSPPTGAELRVALPGSNGPLVCALDVVGLGIGGPSLWSGTTRVLTNAEIAALLLGGGYVVIDTFAFPAGAVRAQLHLDVADFTAHATSTTTSDTGFGFFRFDPSTQRVTYDCSFAGTLPNGVGSVATGSPYGSFNALYFLAGIVSSAWSGTS